MVNAIQYNTTFTSEIKDEDGRQVVMLKGILANDKVNSNLWQLPTEELKPLAAQFAGHPIKLQHANSDWEIIGTGVSAEVVGIDIKYIAKVTDTRAIDKFVSKTWTAENMGISPSVDPTTVTCSICGKEIYDTECPHYVGETYKGKVCVVITRGNKLVESSLTSRPAYEDVGAGTIDDVNIERLVASINKIAKTEEKSMAIEKTITELKAEIDTMKEEAVAVKETVDKATTDIADKDAKIVELEGKLKEATDAADDDGDKPTEQEAEIKTLKESLEASEKLVSGYKKQAQTSELKKVISDEKLVAEILEKDMTDVEFTAEMVKIGKLLKLSAEAEGDEGVDNGGSAPAEGGDANEGKSLVEQEFGFSAEDMVKRILQ